MRRSAVSTTSQILARAWLLAAVASLLLPTSVRLGWWLPLHLALAGAAASAVAGAAPEFAAALSAGRLDRWSWVPLALLTVGAALIAVGFPAGVDALVATGGAVVGLGGLALARTEWTAWRSGINRRHRPIAMLYVFAAACPTAGAALGALLGTGAVSGDAYVAVRRAHVALNLLGFLTLTIVATTVLLIPTVLRVRAPSWDPRLPFASLAAGLTVSAVGFAVDLRPIAALGAAAYAFGALEVLSMAVLALRRRSEHAERAASMHLIASLSWLAVGSVSWAAAAAAGGIDTRLLALVSVFAIGVVVQALLGAWSHLLPMASLGGPDVHRRLLARADRFAIPQVAVYNVGTALLTAAAGGWLPAVFGSRAIVSIAVVAVVVIVKTSGGTVRGAARSV